MATIPRIDLGGNGANERPDRLYWVPTGGREDSALERVLATPKWEYLAPLRQLRPLYWEVKKPQYRLRKHGEVKKDGTLAKKQGRLGPLTLETREWMLGEILRIQDEVNRAAAAVGAASGELD